MTQTVTKTPHQPTTEQSLHSIALSLIEINRVMQDAKRTQTRAFRFSKQEAVRINRRPLEVPKQPSLWRRILDYRYI